MYRLSFGRVMPQTVHPMLLTASSVAKETHGTGCGGGGVTDLLSEVRHLGPRVDLFVGEIFVPIPQLQQLLCSPGFCGSEIQEYTINDMPHMHTNIQCEQPLTWTLLPPRNLPASVSPESPEHPGNTSRDLRTCRKSHRHYGNNRKLVHFYVLQDAFNFEIAP